jgi:ATP-dependent protease ClpP protease subunit
VNTPTTYVSFSAEINQSTAEQLIAVMADLANKGVCDVTLLLSTPGGSVMHGLAVYNTLRGLPFRLTTHNVGNVDSIGNAIFLAGETRVACPHSTFMFHGVGLDVAGGARLERKNLKEHLGSVEADESRIAELIAERSNLSSREASELFVEMQTRDARDALTKGIVHEVRDVNVASGAPVVALAFQR